MHLILVPVGGICNRLRAIGSAVRLCRLAGARCSVVWDWGDFWHFFSAMPNIEILRSAPRGEGLQIRHVPVHRDPSREVTLSRGSVELHSGYVFWRQGEARIGVRDVLPFLPRLSDNLAAEVDTFARQHFADTVGLHMRRTDNKHAIARSPDSMFLERASDLVARGKRLFLATDNAATESRMRRRFGRALLTHPKRQRLLQRWPRQFDRIATEDDLIDLFLLARTQYIVGSFWSSFSDFAIALNGSGSSEILKNKS
jgi:hypothetical protein